MLKKIFQILTGIVIVLTSMTIALLLLQPRIPLGVLSGPVSSLLTSLTGSEQVISGHYYLVPGTWTSLAVEDGFLRLTGDDGFKLEAKVNSAQTTVHLWSLIAGEVNLDGIHVEGMTLDIFTGKEKKQADGDKELFSEFEDGILPVSLKQTGAIKLTDISATIRQGLARSQIQFHLLKAWGQLSRGSAGHLEIEAVLDGRKFTAELTTGPMQDLGKRDTIWPIAAHLTHKSIAAKLTGSVEGTTTGPLLTTNFSLSGSHLDDLVSIVGMHGSKDQPFSIQGEAEFSEENGHVDFKKVQLGEVGLLLAVSVQDLKTKHPRFAVALQSDRLDIDELKGFIEAKEPGRVPSQLNVEKTKISQDDILFPETFPLQHFDIDLNLKELIIAGGIIRDVRLSSSMENGVVTKSPFAASFRNLSLSGYYSLDLVDKEPKITVHLDSAFMNIGAILKEHALANDIRFQLDRAKTDLDTSGRTLKELVNNLVFSIDATGGRFEYKDLNTGAILPVSLHNVKINGIPGKQTTLDAQGEIADIPVNLSMKIKDRRGESSASIKDLSFTQNIQIAGTELEVAGIVVLPYTGTGISLECRLRGERLDSLNELLNLQLPEIGTYDISGTVSLVSEGYRLDDLELQVGSSSLAGTILLDTKVVPPAVAIDLQAQTIQLDDFKEIWLGTSNAGAAEQESQGPEKTDTDEHEKHLLTDQTVLDSYNATVSLSVNEVYSGEDYLGSGLLRIEQQQGQFRISPLQIQLPKGIVDVEFSIEPADQNRHYFLNVTVDDLDYGFVGRWFKPDSDMGGRFSLHTHLESESPDFKSIMANGSGSIKFLLQPEELQAGVIDLWAVNLLRYVASAQGTEDESKINCAAGRFTLRDGVLNRDDLLIDTSRIRITGNLVVDFYRNWIEGRFRPRPKRPQFFSLATPIQIRGPLSDLDVGLASGSGVGTLIRFATDYIAVPIQWIVLGKLPEDGTADCLQIMVPEKQKERPLGNDWYSSP